MSEQFNPKNPVLYLLDVVRIYTELFFVDIIINREFTISTFYTIITLENIKLYLSLSLLVVCYLKLKKYSTKLMLKRDLI